MATSRSAPDAIERPGWGALLRRGFLKKCPQCGRGHQFRGWFRMVERCAGCGLKFEREPGFFVGAYLINFAVTVILLFVVSMAFVAMKAVDNDASLTVPLVVGLVVALVVPVLSYPFSRTIWSAIDIGMTPLETPEIEAMAAALAAGDVGRVDVDDPSRAVRKRPVTTGEAGSG
jgi:uncharacterized protein (DUF983 family)